MSIPGRSLAVILGVLFLSATLSAQNEQSVNRGTRSKERIATELTQFGVAEVKQVAQSAWRFDPDSQPEVYWHDPDWQVDLEVPPETDDPLSLRIHASGGRAYIAKLPDTYAQVDMIMRSVNDRAVVIGHCGGSCAGFIVVDLRQGKVLDSVPTILPHVSPNRRFVIYENAGGEYVGEQGSNSYHLYDLSKSPKENTCGYMENDPKHERLDEVMRGFQVYPQRPKQTTCEHPEDDEQVGTGTNYSWAPDSSDVVFAVVSNGAMTLVSVAMPAEAKDLPKTSVYSLKGVQDVCAGATDSAGEKYCDYHVIQSLGWEGRSVKASFHHRFGTPLDLQLMIPVSQFVSIGK